MGRSFSSRLLSALEPDHQDEVIPENEAVTGATPHYSEGDPDKGIPGFPHPLPGGHEYPVNTAPVRQRLDVPPPSPYYGAGMAHGVKSPVHHDGRISPRDAERRYLEKDTAAPPVEGRTKLQPIPVYLTEPEIGAHPLGQASFRQKIVVIGADPVCLIDRNPSRSRILVLNETGMNYVSVTPPTFPATGVAVQNPYGGPLQVVIAGGTVTAVAVNGTTVGAGPGTYYVPPFGAITVTYTGSPTWTWSTQPVTGGVRLKWGPTLETGALLPVTMNTYRDIKTQEQVYAVTDPNSIANQVLSIIEEYKTGS